MISVERTKTPWHWYLSPAAACTGIGDRETRPCSRLTKGSTYAALLLQSEGRPLSLDDDGSEFPDIHAARKEALRYSTEVLRNEASDSLWDGEPWQLWVTDQPGGGGNTFFTLNFFAVAKKS